MPDFERLTDSLREHQAERHGSARDVAYVRGFNKGKTYARIEILLVLSAIALAATTIYAIYTSLPGGS